MTSLKTAILLGWLLSLSARGETFQIDGRFIPPPGNRQPLLFGVKFFDGDDLTHLFDSWTAASAFSKSFRKDLAPAEGTKKIKATFSPALPGFTFFPDAEMTLTLSAEMHLQTITWSNKPREDAYLNSANAAATALKQDKPTLALESAEYAVATAETGNQKIHAGMLKAQALLATGKPEEAASTFQDVANAENFEKADQSKKKVLVAEWLEAEEKAAQKENRSIESGRVDELSGTLSKVSATYEKSLQLRLPAETLKTGSAEKAKLNIVRELSQSGLKERFKSKR